MVVIVEESISPTIQYWARCLLHHALLACLFNLLTFNLVYCMQGEKGELFFQTFHLILVGYSYEISFPWSRCFGDVAVCGVAYLEDEFSANETTRILSGSRTNSSSEDRLCNQCTVQFLSRCVCVCVCVCARLDLFVWQVLEANNNYHCVHAVTQAVAASQAQHERFHSERLATMPTIQRQLHSIVYFAIFNNSAKRVWREQW